MRELLYTCVGLISRIHDRIMQWNNAWEVNFSDKELHFLVIGLLGMGILFVVYPLFKFLAGKKHEMVIAWIYVFTVLIVITFAIEIGQKITGTGSMEFADIMYGLLGFLAMFAIFCFLRMCYHGLLRLIQWQKARRGEKSREQTEEKEEYEKFGE